MKLFKYESYKVNISEEALALKPFKQLWNRDRTVNKDRAIAELSYVYFMEDPSSDYQYIVDRDDRSQAIIEGEGLDSKWKPDKMVQEAMKFYASFKTTSALILEDTRYAADNLRKSLRNINIEDVDDKGRPIYTVASIISAIKQVPQLVKELSEAERAVAKEMAENNGRVRGQKAKSIFEDGLDL
jgi:uncharacterized protein YoxC